MASLSALQELIEFLLDRAPHWVTGQRDSQRPVGRSFDDGEQEVFRNFFPTEMLQRVRIAVVPTIANPPFYAELESRGIPIPLDFRQMAGITFVDTILVSQSVARSSEEWFPLLFHECVHVLQFQELGVGKFITTYILGWARNGFQYENIPLERDAHDLEKVFRTHPNRPFDALARVREQLRSYAAA